MKVHRDERIGRAVEGLLSEEAWAVFQQEVICNRELRAAYVEALWLHHALRAARVDLAGWDSQTAAVETCFSFKPFRELAVLAAACAAFACGAFFFRKPATLPAVATLVKEENCKWGGSELPTALHSKLGAGTLWLVEGMATIAFESGAVVTLEAPTKLQIRDAMHCRLLEGAVTAEVPEPAHGFTIEAPDLKVIDLGTRFGLTASAVGNSQVRVFEGEVDVAGLPDGKRKRLTQGKGLHVNSGTTSAGQETVQGQQVHEADGWVSIPTSFGRGKDAYSRRGDAGGSLGGQPLVIVKHTELWDGRKNERRAVLTFDVSQISKADLIEAELVLTPVHTGFGFSSLVPDSCFAVYGITDESLDAWRELEMRWESTPGCNEEGPVASQTRRLGEFWIPRGGGMPSITVRGSALAEFIRADSDGLVSFLVIRETGETDPNGLAHGFASKEHPSVRPPTLRLKSTSRP
ncbi:MAG: ferric-dicitrate binding protein FerR [Verrucomicrobia bacterium]|nr:MAG: ferric-dicitrate binding protein FerR [Verrucomicrobiota bacterium]